MTDKTPDGEIKDCYRCKQYRKLVYILYRQLQGHAEYRNWGKVHVEGKGSELMKKLGMRHVT